MPDSSEIKRPLRASPDIIGAIQALKASAVSLIIAWLLSSLVFGGPLWIYRFNYAGTIVASMLMMLLFSAFSGAVAGIFIIRYQINRYAIGVACGILILQATALGGSLIQFYNEGILGGSSLSDAVEDYILKPWFWVTWFGILPAIAVGVWYGNSVYEKADTSASNAS